MANLGTVGKIFGGSNYGPLTYFSIDSRPQRNWRLKPAMISFPSSPCIVIPGEWNKQVKGTVLNNARVPIARAVLAIDSRNYALVNTAYSDATTGAFSIGLPNTPSAIVIALSDSNEPLNAIVFSKVVPIDL